MKVYKREKGGRWYALFFDEKTERRKEKALNTSSEQEAERKRAQWQAECDAGLLDPFSKTKLRKPLTLREALDRYLAAKEEAQRSPETIRNYRTRLNMLLAYVGENRPPRSLSTREIQEFITEEHQRDASKATRFRHVRAFCRWMQEEEILVTDPTKRITYQPRKKEVLPSCVRPDQLEKLCETVRTDWYDKIGRGVTTEQFSTLWYEWVFRFAFVTGMRVSEIARLRWKDIDADRRVLYIREQKNKKEQTIPLSHAGARILSNLERLGDDFFVFHAPGFETTERDNRAFKLKLSRKFCYYKRKAKLPEELSFHSLRHGFCSLLAEKGKPAYVIKELARHADITTSLIYVHLTNQHLLKEVDDVFC